MGHVFRSVALASYFQERGVEVFFAVNDTENELNHFLKEKNMNSVLVSKIKERIFNFLIYDMPFLDESFFKSISENVFEKKIGLDYFQYDQPYIDKTLNLYNHGNPNVASFKVDEGIQFAILRENIIKKTRRFISKAPQTLNNVLITFGSADPRNNTCKVLNSIPDSKFEMIQVILGPLFSAEKECKEILKKYSNTKIIISKNVSDIEDFMLASDIIVCGGGTTLLESIYLGKVSLVLAQTKAELDFAFSLERKNLCRIISREENILKIFNLITPPVRKEIEESCLKTNIGQGKEIIFEKMTEK